VNKLITFTKFPICDGSGVIRGDDDPFCVGSGSGVSGGESCNRVEVASGTVFIFFLALEPLLHITVAMPTATTLPGLLTTVILKNSLWNSGGRQTISDTIATVIHERIIHIF
jgi:hypothetical protein